MNKYLRQVFTLCLITLTPFTAFAAESLKEGYVLNSYEYNQLSKFQRVDYIKELRNIYIEAEHFYNLNLGSQKYSLLHQILFPKANARIAAIGEPCVYGGHMSQLINKNDRLFCERPEKGVCTSENDIECNKALFGPGICVEANGYSTKNCNKKALPESEVVKNFSKADWEELSKINEYCHDPHQFQKVICDKFYNARMRAINKLNPCNKHHQTCEHTTSLHQVVIQICNLKAKIQKKEKKGCFSQDSPDLEIGKECIWKAIKGAGSSLVFLEELKLALKTAGYGLDILFDLLFASGLNQEQASLMGIKGKSNDNEDEPESSIKNLSKEEKSRIVENFLTNNLKKMETDEKFRNKMLSQMTISLHTFSEALKAVANKNIPLQGVTQNQTLLAGKVNCQKEMNDMCYFLGGLGADATVLIASLAVSVFTGGTSTPLTGPLLANKVAKISESLFSLFKKVNFGKKLIRNILAKLNVKPPAIDSFIKDIEFITTSESMISAIKRVLDMSLGSPNTSPSSTVATLSKKQPIVTDNATSKIINMAKKKTPNGYKRRDNNPSDYIQYTKEMDNKISKISVQKHKSPYSKGEVSKKIAWDLLSQQVRHNKQIKDLKKLKLEEMKTVNYSGYTYYQLPYSYNHQGKQWYGEYNFLPVETENHLLFDFRSQEGVHRSIEMQEYIKKNYLK
ncbi:MAG: hypothetical protein HOO06_09915 [Bdellovibrionaceae bacterium]|jgi:hypothetical protein|nr:hypothetical protein [Pseudobdellovibrionaceae bacterium]